MSVYEKKDIYRYALQYFVAAVDKKSTILSSLPIYHEAETENRVGTERLAL